MATVLRNGTLHKAPVFDALATALTSKLPRAKGQLRPGLHKVCGTATIRVDCHIKKDKPTTYTPSVSLDLDSIIILTLQSAGVPLAKAKELVPAIYAAVAQEEKKLSAGLQKKPRQGATRVVGEVEILSFTESR